jgi:cytochrome c biogenesis protein CcmG, thiol:disulfide interchange protein DsbE
MALVLLGAIMLAGCGSTALPGHTGQDGGPTPDVPAAPIAKVPLAPCPTSSPALGSGAGRLPSVTLNCLGPGPAVDMADGHGTPTVVNLWASWCAPCRAEMPRLRASMARLGSDVGFLGVDIKDDPGAAWAFLASVGVHYPNVADPEAKMLAGLHEPGVPVTFVLDPAGAIVFRHIGELREPDIADMESAAKTAR